VRNLNVPADEDAATNSQIHVELELNQDYRLDKIAGQ